MQHTYDSKADTLQHIRRVQQLINDVVISLLRRATAHDTTKLSYPEKEIFDEVTLKLKSLTYGSPEYNDQLKEMKIALDHHYANNSHHPEHYANGIDGMDLLDLIEMLCDWKAATERHTDGDIGRSIEVNKGRFGLSEQLCSILRNTKNSLGY